MTDREKKKGEIIDFLSQAAKRRGTHQPSINIQGNGNIVGNNNTYIHAEKVEHKVHAEVRPGEEHITETQAATIQRLVGEIVRLESLARRKPKSFNAVYNALNRRFGVTRYRLHRRENWPRIETYLRQWIGRLSSTASARRNDDQWRKRKYAYIKTNARQFSLHDALDALLRDRYAVTSLIELNDEDLERVYRTIYRWKQRS